jgi:hypothetical protein
MRSLVESYTAVGENMSPGDPIVVIGDHVRGGSRESSQIRSVAGAEYTPSNTMNRFRRES